MKAATADNYFIPLAPELAAGILRVRGARQLGQRLGNWLSREQARELLAVPDLTSLKGKRDRALLAVLLGCGLRRAELVALTLEHLQQREGRRLRTVPVPAWVKAALDVWLEAAGLCGGRLFRAVNKAGRVWGEGITEKVVWWVVRDSAGAIAAERLAPHDLRRTCAKLCRAAGGELEQIQLLLGHASVQSTERYLGTKQNLAEAVNDKLGLVEN